MPKYTPPDYSMHQSTIVVISSETHLNVVGRCHMRVIERGVKLDELVLKVRIDGTVHGDLNLRQGIIPQSV